MDKHAQFNMLINFGEADDSHGDAVGKSILHKRKIEEEWNKDDSLKDAHVAKLKKPKQAQFNMLINFGEADDSHGDAVGKSILHKRKIEEEWNKDDSLKDAHVAKLKKPKQATCHFLKKSGESINLDRNDVLKRILEKSIIEEDNNGQVENVCIPKLQKPIRPSAIRDFPFGCGRYASPVAQKCLTLPVLASEDYVSGYGRNVTPVTKEHCLLAGAPDRVKECSQPFSKLNDTNRVKKENGDRKREGGKRRIKNKFRASLDPDSVKKENDARNTEKKTILSPGPPLKESCYLSPHSSQVRNKEGGRNREKKNILSRVKKEDEKKNILSRVKKEDDARNIEKNNILSCRPALKESCYLSPHASQARYKILQHSKVPPRTGNINQLANMTKKEAIPGHSTINVEGCSQHKTNGNNKYKVVATSNPLCFKIVKVRDQPSEAKFVTNTPKLAPSKALANVQPKFATSTPKLAPSKALANVQPKFATNTPKLEPSKAVANVLRIDGEPATRSKVRETLRLFQLVCRIFLQNQEASVKDPALTGILQNQEASVKDPALTGKCLRVDILASKLLRENNMYVNTGEKIVGDVPGVEVGDQFHYRIELCIVGLHRQVQGGIDFLKQGNKPLATSIVVSGGYEDDVDSGDVLIYTGQGGNNYRGDKKQSKDQTLGRGNLALTNSIDQKIPVRVIRGFKEKNTGNDGEKKNTVHVIYKYDGLYDVQEYWLENGASGYSVYKFRLKRQPGQPELGSKTVQFGGSKKKYSSREGVLLDDISGGAEKKCICVVNTVDENRPPQFIYTAKVIYPSQLKPMRHKGCDCTDGCLDPSKCYCALKNGGEFPFNYDGAIVRAKPIVYECGPSCSCSQTCHNRVSQRGVRYNLQVFKTDKRGWGVRSSDSIASGSFICEYTGKLLSEAEAEECVGNDDYLFDVGRNCNSEGQCLWSGVSILMPEIQADAACDMVDDVGYTIDAAKHGNVGRFVNHSCSPNLYAQNVLYDHDDRSLPHIMLFAAENIPPMRELFYHYNYTVDQVYDCYGNIKKKACYCGSSECIGRMY